MRRVYQYDWLKAPIVMDRDVQGPSIQKTIFMEKRRRRVLKGLVPIQEESEDRKANQA